VLEKEHNGRVLMDLLAERLAKEALAGKFPFIKEVLDRLDGRVAERVSAEGPAEGVVINVVRREAPRPDDPRALPGPKGESDARG